MLIIWVSSRITVLLGIIERLMPYLHAHISSCLFSISNWMANDCEKCSKLHVWSHISHLKSQPCYSETLLAACSLCNNLPPPSFFLILSLLAFQVCSFSFFLQQPTNRLPCLTLTMHTLGLSFSPWLASQSQEGREALLPVSVSEVEGILSPRGGSEKVINWKHPHEYGKSNIEVGKNAQRCHSLLFSCIRKLSF